MQRIWRAWHQLPQGQSENNGPNHKPNSIKRNIIILTMFLHSCAQFNPHSALCGTKIREALKTFELSAQTCHPRHMSVMIRHVNPPDACEMSALQTEPQHPSSNAFSCRCLQFFFSDKFEWSCYVLRRPEYLCVCPCRVNFSFMCKRFRGRFFEE